MRNMLKSEQILFDVILTQEWLDSEMCQVQELFSMKA
jgi:hypothetical protein